MAPGRIGFVAGHHHDLLLGSQEPSFRWRLREDEPKQGDDHDGHGTFDGEQPSPTFEVGGPDLSESISQNTTKSARESAEGKDEGRSLATLRLFVDPAEVYVDARDESSLEQANKKSAGVQSAVVLNESCTGRSAAVTLHGG